MTKDRYDDDVEPLEADVTVEDEDDDPEALAGDPIDVADPEEDA